VQDDKPAGQPYRSGSECSLRPTRWPMLLVAVSVRCRPGRPGLDRRRARPYRELGQAGAPAAWLAEHAMKPASRDDCHSGPFIARASAGAHSSPARCRFTACAQGGEKRSAPAGVADGGGTAQSAGVGARLLESGGLGSHFPPRRRDAWRRDGGAPGARRTDRPCCRPGTDLARLRVRRWRRRRLCRIAARRSAAAASRVGGRRQASRGGWVAPIRAGGGRGGGRRWRVWGGSGLD